MTAFERCWTLCLMTLIGCGMPAIGRCQDPPEVLEGTGTLDWSDDLASRMYMG